VPRADLSLPGLAVSDVHEVRSGETLSGIAHRYGTSVSSLRRLNGMGSGESLIFAGERLIVHRTPEEGVGKDGMAIHVVARGENLSVIAAGYGVSLKSLLKVNGLNLRAIIYPGQKLKIPLP
jgi:N-acetylmuramoyl-L-alanine amidase